jgi:hypothetical protein
MGRSSIAMITQTRHEPRSSTAGGASPGRALGGFDGKPLQGFASPTGAVGLREERCRSARREQRRSLQRWRLRRPWRRQGSHALLSLRSVRENQVDPRSGGPGATRTPALSVRPECSIHLSYGATRKCRAVAGRKVPANGRFSQKSLQIRLDVSRSNAYHAPVRPEYLSYGSRCAAIVVHANGPAQGPFRCYAASGTARARLSACVSRASIVRSA